MATRRLYYEDCHLTGFSGQVLGCEKTAKGWEVTLDATAFYPEGGGQACDLGVLGGVKVLDVQERGEDVIHLCDGALDVGQTVAGTIDYDRRFDLMQQHTGEHIVSGLVNAMFGYHNVGFHMGAEGMEVDFDGVIPAEKIPKIEAAANRAVWANLPVKCWYPSPEELPEVFYRTKRALPWPVRIVQIPGVDSCACCGVHTAFTGEVGLVKIFSCVKFHQGVRLVISCGRQALERLNRVYEQNKQVSQAFSAKMNETGEAARRMNDTLAGEKYRAAGLQKQVFTLIAENYVNQKLALRFEPGMDSNLLRELADCLAAKCPGVAAVFSGDDSSGYGVCLASRSADVKALGGEMAKTLNGRGGGKPGFFQGRVAASREQIEKFFAERTFS